MTLLLGLLSAVLVGYGAWSLAGVRRERPAARQAVDDRNLDLWLLGNPVPAKSVPLLQAVAALLAATVAAWATGNIVIAALAASLGWYMPATLIGDRANRVWGKGDDQAHTLANVLQFALPVQGNPLRALRHVVPDLDQPLRGWLEQVLAGEAVGVPVEQGLAELADRLRHQELGLLADILREDRRSAPAHQVLAELLPDWTSRVRLASERRSSLAVAQGMTLIFIWLPMIGFLAVDGLLPAGAVFHATLIGQAIATAGFAVLAAAAHLARSTAAGEWRARGE